MDPPSLGCDYGAVRNGEGKDAHICAIALLERNAVIAVPMDSQSIGDLRDRLRFVK
jgi:hypothetical protein